MHALRASKKKVILPFRGRVGLFVALGIAMGAGLTSLPVQATHSGAPEQHVAKASREGVTVATKEPDVTGSVQSDAAENAACDRSRKRLFVEGEGWIVRRVTTCY